MNTSNPTVSPRHGMARVQTGRLVAGLLFLLTGVAFLLEALGLWTWEADEVLRALAQTWRWAVPSLVVLAGVMVLLSGLRK